MGSHLYSYSACFILFFFVESKSYCLADNTDNPRIPI